MDFKDEYINKSEAILAVTQDGCTANVVGVLYHLPPADVVPKSEYEAVVSAVDNSTQEFLRLHDDYQEAKREVENLKVLLEMTEKAHEGLKELYRTDTDALVEARRKTEIEVARGIFAEIEKIRSKEIHKCETLREQENEVSQRKYWEGGYNSLRQLSYWIAELKKKYTEGEG